MTNQEEYKVIRGSVNGQEKYCRIPIRRKVDNAMAIRMIQKEVEQLKKACEEDCPEIELSETDFEQRIEIFELAIAALEKQERKKWHPICPDDLESFPDNGRLVLVSFSNVPGNVDIARWRTDLDGGMFCPGDEDYPYTRSGIFVNAWRELPESYLEEDNAK